MKALHIVRRAHAGGFVAPHQNNPPGCSPCCVQNAHHGLPLEGPPRRSLVLLVHGIPRIETSRLSSADHPAQESAPTRILEFRSTRATFELRLRSSEPTPSTFPSHPQSSDPA